MTNGEDPYKIPHKAAFHQGLLCLQKQNQSSEEEIQYVSETIICDPSIYTIDHPDLTVSIFMENSIGLKRVQRITAFCLFLERKTMEQFYQTL